MKFSVLMSVYYKENPDFFDKALESTINQTLKPNEIVIVLDGKLTTELYDLLDKYKTKFPGLINTIQLEQNVGLGKALEFGINNCKYDLIARMDSDDICVPERFEKQINFMVKNPDVKVLGSWIGEFEHDPEVIESVRKVPVEYDEILKYAKTRSPLNHMTVVYWKNCVIEAGNYQTLLMNEDYYLWVRMLNKGFKMMNIPEILVLARAGSDMFKRRGGLRYIQSERQLQKTFLEMNFIDRKIFLFNIATRGLVRLLPNSIRGFIYKTLLRK
ncbi:glycosyltransferase involved in cell wall biosynthesis [Neobacillus niacini]|uniref:glycosyltransferase n=1 Tax=Neobacillus niacini TaxID=86668 RepID=UPI00277DBD8A|nr:glycosyltransferase [Neobacillus niacini]MDQ1000806.1 glycosyltransferase involved in cell wall biosynthesis [Neobacillus niacini]